MSAIRNLQELAVADPGFRKISFGLAHRRGVAACIMQLRRALQISLGDPLTLVQSPMSATRLAIALIALVASLVLKGLGRFQASED